MSAEPLVSGLPSGTLVRYRTLGAALRTRGEHEAADAILELTELLRAVDGALVSEHEAGLRMAEVVRKHVPRWIPVEERLPEPERPVLVAIDNGPRLPSYVEWEPYIMCTGERWAPAGGPLEWWTEGQGYVLSGVTHWQPLPAPPETKP